MNYSFQLQLFDDLYYWLAMDRHVVDNVSDSTIPASSTSSTLDLGRLLEDYENPNLLQVSLSAGSLSTESDDAVPPFPSGHRIPITSLADLKKGVLKHTGGLHSKASMADCYARCVVTVTTPTIPRISQFTKGLPICVDMWRVCLFL